MKKPKLYVDQLLARLAKHAKVKKPKRPFVECLVDEIHAFRSKPVSETGMRDLELFNKLRLHYPTEMNAIMPKPKTADSGIIKDDVPELPDTVQLKTGEEL